MPEIRYPAYRAYVESRVTVNDAMVALLAGSRLAAHTLSLTAGSTATLGELFPAVPHINRFNLRSDAARALLADADSHIASVAVPYALATHEDFVMGVLDFLKNEGWTLARHGKPVRAWNMHTVLFETLGESDPADWLESFHVLRLMRNCITHEGGAANDDLRAAIAAMGHSARAGWENLNQGLSPEAVEFNGRLALTAEHVFASFAVTKGLGRAINALLARQLPRPLWARIVVEDYNAQTGKFKNSSGWRRALIGYARMNYTGVQISDAELETASRDLGLWTIPDWN